jgi:hypothetical protein
VTDVAGSTLADAIRDRYRRDRELGQGGMATVFLAHDLHNPFGASDSPSVLRRCKELLTMVHFFTRPGHHEQFNCDFHILEFSDEGALRAQPRLEEVEERVRALRREFSSGVVVVFFIHGWHHSADSEDEHLNAFRRIVEVITVREWEGADRPVRPVVGVYVGWNGDPIGRWSAIKRMWGIKHLSFWRRYRVAKSLGGSLGVQKTLVKIISAAKAPLDDAQGNRTVESPLVLAGHSMGSLILQSALEKLLRTSSEELLFRDVDSERVRLPDVRTFRNGARVFFPDLLLCLNSAADSDIARGIIKVLNESKIKRCAETPPYSALGIKYDAPLFVSITSTVDTDTRRIWRWAQLVEGNGFSRRTDGHDPTLFTHTMTLQNQPARCPKRENVLDFGQAWHCLHVPQPPEAARPAFPIDLPKEARKAAGNLEHERWLLAPKQNAKEVAEVAWIFQVPGTISKCHNDIFGTRTSALFMTMLQISGAVVGLAHDFASNFEPPAN